MSIFFLFSFFIEIISLVTECIFWQLSNQKYFGFLPNIKTCQKNWHTHHGINIKRHAVLDNWLYPCENFYEISPRSRRDLAENRGEISARSRRDRAARYGNLGRQIRGEMLQRDRGEIRKSRRPKRAVIARWYRGEIWISRRAVSRRGLGGSLAGICGEKRNSWRSKSYCYPVEKRNSRQPN